MRRSGARAIGWHKAGFRHILYQLTHNRAVRKELVRLTKLSAPTVSVTLSQMELWGLSMQGRQKTCGLSMSS